MKTLMILTIVILANTAFAGWNNPANEKQEKAIVEKLIPEGFVLAGDYKELDDPMFEETEGSFVFNDFNKDGGQDVAMMVEQTVIFDDGSWHDKGAENRELMIFFGQWDGTYKLVGTSKALILNQGEGGVAVPYGDPFMGLSINAGNSLVIKYWGGSAHKWSYSFKVNYRTVGGRTAFYFVGRDEMYMSWHYVNDEVTDMAITNISHNLITGRKVETVTLMGDEDNNLSYVVTKDEAPLKSLGQLTESFVFGYE